MAEAALLDVDGTLVDSKEAYAELIGEVKSFEGARELIADLKERGRTGRSLRVRR